MSMVVRVVEAVRTTATRPFPDGELVLRFPPDEYAQLVLEVLTVEAQRRQWQPPTLPGPLAERHIRIATPHGTVRCLPEEEAPWVAK